jgi:hypothetical protein
MVLHDRATSLSTTRQMSLPFGADTSHMTDTIKIYLFFQKKKLKEFSNNIRLSKIDQQIKKLSDLKNSAAIK